MRTNPQTLDEYCDIMVLDLPDDVKPVARALFVAGATAFYKLALTHAKLVEYGHADVAMSRLNALGQEVIALGKTAAGLTS